MSDREQLLSFGFPPERVDWALKATGGRGLQVALDFLVENEDKPVPDQANVTEQATPKPDVDDEDEEEELRAAMGLSMTTSSVGESSTSAIGDAGGSVQSIRCSVCGKIFRDTSLANYHAEKSGHDQFEESTEEVKPLTEEEKQQRLVELRQRAIEKKAAKSVEEAKEAKANEIIRRKAGQDRGSAVENLKLKEAEKDAQRKKQEKLDDAKARAAIKAQIAADKKERAEKQAREKALREGREYQTQSAAGPSTPTVSTPAPTAVKGSEYKDTRLQIRLASGGAPLTTTLPSTSTLREVAEFVAGQSLAYDVDTVSFTMQFPRKTFTRSDFEKSLKDLGLTPSAVLIAS